MNVYDIVLLVSIICCKIQNAATFQLSRTKDSYAGRIFQLEGRNELLPLQPTLKLQGRDSSDDDYIDEDELGDWRSFRNNLLETGFSSSSTASSSEGYIGDDQVASVQSGEDDSFDG